MPKPTFEELETTITKPSFEDLERDISFSAPTAVLDPNKEAKKFTKTIDNADKLNISLADSEDYQDSLESIEKKKPVGFIGGLTEDALFKIPIAGPLLEGLDLARIKLASIRLNDPDFDWEIEAGRERARLEYEYLKPRLVPMSRQEYFDRRKAVTAESARQDDIDGVTGYITAMAAREERGYNFWGRVGQGISVLPAWMFEFALTGGLYRTGSASVKKLLQKHARGKLIAKTGGWLAGSAVRTTVGMPQRTFANTMRRSLNQDEGWATSIALGWGETFIEAASEQAGQTITGGLSYVTSGAITKMPFGSKFLSALQKAWVKLSPDNTAAKFAKKIATKAGYSNLIGEYGEERLATLLHGMVGTETFGLPEGADIFDRVLAGVKQDLELTNALSEVVVLSVPGAIKVSVGQLGKFADDARLRKAIETKIGVSPEAAKKAVEIKNGEGGVEKADEYLSAVKTVGEKVADKVITPPTEGVQAPSEAVAGRTTPEAKIIPTKAVEVAVEAKELNNIFMQDEIRQRNLIAGRKSTTSIRGIEPSTEAKDAWNKLREMGYKLKNPMMPQLGFDLAQPVAKAEPTKAVKEIKDVEEKAITEPTPSPEVEPRKAGKIIPTGKLDPTNAEEALEIIRLHAQFVAGKERGSGVGGIFETKWDKEKKAFVVTSIEYTSKQVDTAYRTIQKPVESPMPDTDLFAMPGKEAQMKAIAQKMAKVKGVYRPKKMGPKALTKPTALPKAKTKIEDNIKAVYAAADKGVEARPAFSGVKVEGDTLIASDGRRMFWAKGKWGKDGLYLDVATLKKGSLGKPTKEKINFPKWRDIVPDVSDQKPILVNLEAALSHIRQAAILTSEESKGITVIENKDERMGLGFAAASPEVGHAEINVEPGGRILGALNPQYLLNVIKFHAIRGDTNIEFYFSDPTRPMLTKSLDGKTNTLTMPINPGEPSEAITKAISEGKPPSGVGKIGFPGKAAGGEMPKTLEPTAKEPVTARQIITSLSKALNVPYAGMATHRPRAAAGWYEVKERGIRQIDVRDLETATHEVGHHIDHYFKIRQAGISRVGQKIFKMPEGTVKGTAAELVRLGKMLYGTRKPPGGYKSEGIAEYIRGYLTGHLNVEKEAPKFHKWFTEDYLPNNPEVATGLENARALLTNYRLQGAEARIESQISTKEIKGSLSDRANAANLWFQQMFVDEFAPLRKGLEEAGIKGLKPAEDPYELAVYFTQKEGARARQMVLFGTIDLWGNKTGKGLKEIMKPIADENSVRPFTHFVVAARSLNLLKRGINPGISKEDAQYVYDKYKDNEGWLDTAKEITEWNHRVLEYLVQAGALPKETADKMIENNPIYVPFLRAFVKGEKRFGGGGAGAGLITTKKGVFAIKGSGREIIDPFESMITQTKRMIAIAHKSVIARSLANLEARHRGLAGLIWKVPTPKQATTFRAEQVITQFQKMGVDVSGAEADALMTIYSNSPIYLGKENIIAIVQDGKKTWYEVSPDMYKLLQGLDKFYMPRFLDIVFGKPGRAMRLGATGLNASFGLVRNPIRDMQDTIFKGKHARGPGATVKGVAKDLSRLGLAKSMGIEPSKAAEAFVSQGGQISGFIGQDRRSLQHLKGELLASSVGRYTIQTLKHPIDAMREVFGVAETGPRIQEYEKALEFGEKKYGKGSPDAKVYAFNKAQDQTINYSRHGIIGKWLNQMIPFWNANIQDISKVQRTFRERGKEATAYAVAFLTLPALGLWWYNKDEEWYKELPAYEKANYLHVKIPGKDSIVRIPVPFLVGHIFQGFPVATVDALYNADKTKVTEFFKEVLRADVYSLAEWPAIISPVIDVLQNKDWAGRPIVPRSVEEKLPSDQYKEYTTQFAKVIGEIFEVSPAQIEHLMNSYSGGLYRRVTSTAELVAGRREKELAAVDIPIIGKLFVRDPYAPKASIERFYKRKELLEAKFQSDKITGGEIAERAIHNSIGNVLTELWKLLKEEKTIDGRKKLYRKIDEIIKVTVKAKRSE